MTATTALMLRAALYVAEHRSEFDPAKPGVFYGHALFVRPPELLA